MKIALTGATGFLGSHLAQGLSDDGHELVLLARDPAKLIPDLKDCRVMIGDLHATAKLREFVQDAKAVVHCAAYVAEWGPREEYFRTNVTGTRNLIEACAAEGRKRFIHISSNSVYGDGTGDHLDTPEETPYRLTGLAYCDSKIEAERLVLAAHQSGAIVATALRPGLIWGPRDRQFVPKIIDALSKGLMLYLGGGDKLLGLTHVENIMDVLRRCLARKVSHGRVYNVDDDDRRTLRDLVRALCSRLHYKEPRISVPLKIALPLAAASEFIWSLAGAKSTPLMTRLGVVTLSYSNDVSVERAKRELGYAPQDLFDRRLDAYLRSWKAGG